MLRGAPEAHDACCKIAITLKTPSMSVMAFHEKAGPGQVDFDLPLVCLS
jgi:hypothetical protein